jgi:hypothetical protein
MVHRYVFFSKSNAGFSGLQILFDMFNPARPVVSPEMLLYVFFQNPARVFPDCKFFLICLIQRSVSAALKAEASRSRTGLAGPVIEPS